MTDRSKDVVFSSRVRFARNITSLPFPDKLTGEEGIYSVLMRGEEKALAPLGEFRMYRMKDHFEYRVQNPEVEVAPGIFRREAVPVSGAWDDSRMYSPYPYEESILNPGLKR